MNLCVLFGGISPEHEVSLRSAESVLNHLNAEKYNIYPVGITKEGKWIYFPGTDYSMLPADTWREVTGACPAAISPVRGQGLLLWRGGGGQVILILQSGTVLKASGTKRRGQRDYKGRRIC